MKISLINLCFRALATIGRVIASPVQKRVVRRP